MNKEEIIELIASAKTLNAITKLKNEIQDNSIFYKELIMLLNRYNTNKINFRKGIISEEDSRRELVKINYALLDFIIDYFKLIDTNISRDNNYELANKKFQQVLLNYTGIKINCVGIDNSLKYHKEDVFSWAKFISFKEIQNRKSLTEVYIDLDFYLTPRSNQIMKSTFKTIKFDQIFNGEDSNILIIGQPGAGKTTTTKKIALDVYNPQSDLCSKFTYPIVIRLRELNMIGVKQSNSGSILFIHLLSILGIGLGFDSKESINDYDEYFRDSLIQRATIQLVEQLGVLVILDGFDELSHDLQSKILPQINNMSSRLTNSRLILTTRTGDFYFNLENTSEYEIKSLSNNQIKDFIIKWFNDERRSDDLYSKIIVSPFYDAMIRPLTLAHLCAIYEKYNDIPEKPKTIYKKIVNLLLEEWDNQRSIKRNSSYSRFEIDRKFEFLSSVAFVLTTTCKTTVFSTSQLHEVYNEIHGDFGLPLGDCDNVMKEIETHNGLILKTGYDKFEFAHKSIQEYLTAEYIVKLPNLLSKYVVNEYPNELALTIAISSNPTLYFITFVLQFLNKQVPPNFVENFFERLFVEKPDFSQNTLLGLSILKLFTLCNSVQGEIIAEKQFLKLIQVESISKSIYDAVQYYRLKGEGKCGLYYLENVKTYYDDKFILAGGYSMPKTLLIHPKFTELNTLPNNT